MAQRKPRVKAVQNEAIPPQPAPAVQEVDIVRGSYPDFDPDAPEAEGGYDGGIQELDDDDGEEVLLPTDEVDDTEPIDLMPVGGELGDAATRQRLIEEHNQREAEAAAARAAVPQEAVVTVTQSQLDAEVERRVQERLLASSLVQASATTSGRVAVVERPVEVVEPAAKTFIVRTNADVGPIFYGKDEIAMKKHVKYRVPEHIFKYLEERDLIYSRS